VDKPVRKLCVVKGIGVQAATLLDPAFFHRFSSRENARADF
jgi:hypothetical protein